MKKGLLLSVVASTMIFAGGDIAPVEPAAAAPAADCSDFYGVVGAYFQTHDTDEAGNGDLFDKANNRFDVTATIGVEKTLFGGIGFGAEVSGWSSVGSRIASFHRVDNRVVAGNYEGGTLSQLFLTASFGNTAIKAGRFAIPGSLSPLLKTNTTAGVKNTTYDGVLIANTDLADTTIYGVWAYAIHTNKNGMDTKIGKTDDPVGAFALGFQNKSIANTTITAVGYYGPDFFETLGRKGDAKAAAVNVNTTFGDYGIDGQFTYVTGEKAAAGKELDATMTAGLRVSATFGDFDAKLVAAYRNDGGNRAVLAGGTGSLIGDDIDFTYDYEAYGIGAELSYKVWTGRAYGRVSYEDFKSTTIVDDSVLLATAGYTFKVADIDFKAEYQYGLTKKNAAGAADVKSNRVRLEAAYKF